MTSLAEEHLHGFLGSLDDVGIAVSAPKKGDFLGALVASPPADVESLYWRARVTLVSGPEAFDAFDAVFDAWFRGGLMAVEDEAACPPDESSETAAPNAGGDGELEAVEAREGSGLHASTIDVTSTRTFAPTTAEGHDQLRDLSATLAAVLPTVTGRRARRSRRSGRLDVRRVLRATNRNGGEIVDLSWLRRPLRARRVLLLVDISGSQRLHSPDLLRFAHEVVRVADRAEAFTFGTRLTRVTGELRTRDVDAALASLAETVLDADGGTRIGVALNEFLDNSRYVALARGALIIVMSDGLERGDPAAMAEAIRRLSRLGHRLLWWSPLACDPAYRPVTRGIQSILDDVDELAGARDLPGLLEVARGLPGTLAGPRRAAARAWLRDRTTVSGSDR